MNDYLFDVTVKHPDGAGTLQVDTKARYGHWEHRDGTEGGGLWFDYHRTAARRLELVDFDGHTHLPATWVKALRAEGFEVGPEFD